jgi:acyl carrier protein
MSEDTVILQILHELTAIPIEKIRPEHHLGADLGMDSVRSMELIGMLEERLGIEIDLDVAMDADTVEAIGALVRKHRVC